MGWRVLYIDEGEKCSLYMDNIKIKNAQEDKELVVPIKDLHTLIIDNYKTVLTAQLINALSEKNVNVVICSVEHLPRSLLIPHMGSKHAPMMLRKQLKWRKHVKKILHQDMVRAKINNQIELLSHIDADSGVIMKLKSYGNDVVLGDKTNREGLAAKVYFRALFGSGFERFSEDTLNAGLNYGYAILRSQISKALLAKGLNTALGFFHHNPNNHFNLSDDFIEPFRPLIDHYVYSYLREEKIFRKEHKLSLIKHTTKKVQYKSVRQTFFNAVNQYVDSVVSFAETGDYEKLHHPVIDFNAL